ncbi:MAG: transcriptional repressor LexA [Deltaproteobacteria bacterium]|nr:transcriptional repressor LexA [Deltaproteobacteria bacterium]
MEELTGIQVRVLDALRGRADTGQALPSYRALCAEFGWSSTGTARDHLRALERKGYVDLPGSRGRRVRLRRRFPGIARAPIVGRIAAGKPVLADQYHDDLLPFPAEWRGSGDCFALRVAGDSMEGAGILEGDHVIIRQQEIADNGDIVAATLGGETTLKRLVKDGDRTFLVAENPRYAPIEVTTDSAVVHGVVVGLLRSYRLHDSRSPFPGNR